MPAAAVRPSAFDGELSLEDGYLIGHELHQRLVSRGLKPAGRKIGFTNRALWEQFQSQRTDPAAPLRADDSLCPRRKAAALACRYGRSAAGTGSRAQALRTRSVGGGSLSRRLADRIEWVAIGFEIVDCHFADWRFTAAEAVADFGFHAALVVGTPCAWTAEERAGSPRYSSREGVALWRQGFPRGGQGAHTGQSTAGSGSLGRVLATQPWAAPLESGEVITTGTLTPLPNLRSGESYSVQVEGRPLPPLRLELGD